VATWTVEQVVTWAKRDVKLDEEDAEKLRKQKVDGATLIEMAKLEQDKLIVQLERYGIPGGPATKLAAAIKGLVSEPTMAPQQGMFIPIVTTTS
jgi:hypothetical protein